MFPFPPFIRKLPSPATADSGVQAGMTAGLFGRFQNNPGKAFGAIYGEPLAFFVGSAVRTENGDLFSDQVDGAVRMDGMDLVDRVDRR